MHQLHLLVATFNIIRDRLRNNIEVHGDIDDGKDEHMHRDYDDGTLVTGTAYENCRRSDDFIYGLGLKNGMESDMDFVFSLNIE